MITVDEARKMFAAIEQQYYKPYKGKMKWDQEMAHYNADKVLCAMLRDLGYDEIVDIYEAIPKWYA